MRNIILGSVCFLAVATSCSNESVGQVKNDYQSALANGDDFAALPQELVMGQPTSGLASAKDDTTFYLAIKKNVMAKKWFLSAFLTQTSVFSSGNNPVSALGTRVVSFKQQNGKLFMFDVDSTHTWSNEIDPEIIVDAFPIVQSAAFDKLAGANEYVLIDPAAGMNKFSAYSERLANYYAVQFTTDIVYSKRFNKYKDGISFDQVFTGHSNVPDTEGTFFDNTFSSSGTMTMSIREYNESDNFTPSPMVGVSGGGALYFGSKVAIVPNDGSYTQSAIKWAFNKGQPKKWVISRTVLDIAQDPAFAGYDVLGAMTRGVEAWNEVFGYKVFDVSVASTTDTVGDEDKSFVFIDSNPSAGYAFANWRDNPNTGEIRAASVYFSSVWFLAALQAADSLGVDPAGSADAGTPSVAGLAPSKADLRAMAREDVIKALTEKRTGPVQAQASGLSWNGLERQDTCSIRADLTIERLKLNKAMRTLQGKPAMAQTLSKKEVFERFLAHVLMHEVGHTLGLRHNFKGSLSPSADGLMTSSSVMDYLNDPDSVSMTGPGSYDIAAIKYLYGMSTQKPTDKFCNDSYIVADADCNMFDTGTNPYDDAKFWYNDIVDNIDIFAYFFGLDSELHTFARGSKSAAVRADAFNTLMKPARAIDPSLLAQDDFYGIWYDILAEYALQASYLMTPDQLNSMGIRITTKLSSSTQPATIANCSAIIENSDKIRSFSSRSTCVTVLDTLHTDAALTALKTVRADLDKPEMQPPSTASVAEKAQFDSLKAKIDRVTLAWVK